MKKRRSGKGFGVNSSPNSSRNENHYQGNRHNRENHSQCRCLRNLHIAIAGVAIKFGKLHNNEVTEDQLETIAIKVARAIDDAHGKSDIAVVLLGDFAFGIHRKWFQCADPSTIHLGIKVKALNNRGLAILASLGGVA